MERGAAADLDEILEAPRVRELACGPRLIHRQVGDVIALWLEELRSLLVGLRLLLLWAIPNVLDREREREREREEGGQLAAL